VTDCIISLPILSGIFIIPISWRRSKLLALYGDHLGLPFGSRFGQSKWQDGRKLATPRHKAMPRRCGLVLFIQHGRRFAVEVRNEVRAPWVKPGLVQKPLEETRAGRGGQFDGLGDRQS
jgi:hypothetical protein